MRFLVSDHLASFSKFTFMIDFPSLCINPVIAVFPVALIVNSEYLLLTASPSTSTTQFLFSVIPEFSSSPVVPIKLSSAPLTLYPFLASTFITDTPEPFKAGIFISLNVTF